MGGGGPIVPPITIVGKTLARLFAFGSIESRWALSWTSLTSQVVIPPWTPDGVTPSCGYWSEVSNEWKADGVVLGSANVGADGTSSTTCWTFHLSPFAITEEQGASFQWIAVQQLTDANVLQEVGRASVPGLIVCVECRRDSLQVGSD